MYIEKITSPADVKKLDMGQLVELAGEMRQCLIKRGSIHGGHFGPNLGMVEAYLFRISANCGGRLLKSKLPLSEYPRIHLALSSPEMMTKPLLLSAL